MPARFRRADLTFFTDITPGKTKEFNASSVKIHGVFHTARIVGTELMDDQGGRRPLTIKRSKA